MPFHLFWLVGVLFLMAVAAVVVVGVVLAATRLQSPPLHAGGAAPPAGTPLDILARRFAAGEITAEEYEKARDLLQGGGNSKT
jgi:uncharacterized membrane protein